MPRVIRAEVMRLRMLKGARAAEVFQPCASSFLSLMNAKTAITMQHVGALFKSPVRFSDCTQHSVLGQTKKVLFNL